MAGPSPAEASELVEPALAGPPASTVRRQSASPLPFHGGRGGQSSRAASAWQGSRAALGGSGIVGPIGRPVGRTHGQRRRIARTADRVWSRSSSLAGASKSKGPAGARQIAAEQLQVAVAGPREPVKMALGNHHAHLAGGPHAGDPLHRARPVSSRPEPSDARKKMLSAQPVERVQARRVAEKLASTWPVSGSSFLVSSRLFCAPRRTGRRRGSRSASPWPGASRARRRRTSRRPSATRPAGRRSRAPIGTLHIHRALPAADVAVARAIGADGAE